MVDAVGRHNHLAYYGDRTTEALTQLADQAAEAHGKKPHLHGIQNANAINQKGSGCNFSGMLLVKKYVDVEGRSMTAHPADETRSRCFRFPRPTGCRARCTSLRVPPATVSTICR